MSLINQMLKDLEQRGAGSTNTAKITSTNFNTNTSQSSPFPFIKIGLLATLLAGGIYSWLQTSPKSPLKTDISSTALSVVSPESKPELKNEKLQPAPASAQTNVVQSPINEAPKAGLPESQYPKAKAASLFETELRYTPADFKPLSKKAQKDQAPIESTSTTKTNDVNPASKPSNSAVNSPEQEKAPALKHISSRLSTKLNSDSSATGKEIRPDQKSGNYYRLGISNLQQGRVSEAQANLVQALEANPANQEARQALAGLLLDNKRNDEAKTVLAAGLAITPEQSDFRMALARLQVEAGDKASALSTLEQGLPYAKTNADYQAFTATMLQRADRHEEAITHYMTAVSLNSNTTSTLIGLGISLQAVGKLENAKEAFTRAQSSTALTPDLSAFVEQRLKQINQRLRN